MDVSHALSSHGFAGRYAQPSTTNPTPRAGSQIRGLLVNPQHIVSNLKHL